MLLRNIYVHFKSVSKKKKCVFLGTSSLASQSTYKHIQWRFQEISSKFFNLATTSFYDGLRAFNNDTVFSPFILYCLRLRKLQKTQRITYCKSIFFSPLLLLFSSPSEFAVYHNIVVKTGGNVQWQFFSISYKNFQNSKVLLWCIVTNELYILYYTKCLL